MSINSLDAANAYGNALKNMGNAKSSKGDDLSLSGFSDQKSPAFSDLIKDALSETATAMSASEGVTIDQLNSKADLVDVVTTVQNAEMVLETVVAVRDKVISAYQDIIKMPM